jgi:NAD(P)-dependent dehydrogenase (short-subunit alcohol dehydrogenase family)
MQQALSTNFFGHLRVIKGALPTMRAQKSGTIVLISSVYSMFPLPAYSAYSCPKAASDMLYETLKYEVGAFGIRTLVLNAGMYQTSVILNSPTPAAGFGQPYLEETLVGRALGLAGTFVEHPEDTIAGDPAKFGDCVVDLVDGTGHGKGLEKQSRVVMGRDSVEMIEKKLKWLTAEVEGSRKIAGAADYEGRSKARGNLLLADLVDYDG